MPAQYVRPNIFSSETNVISDFPLDPVVKSPKLLYLICIIYFICGLIHENRKTNSTYTNPEKETDIP